VWSAAAAAARGITYSASRQLIIRRRRKIEKFALQNFNLNVKFGTASHLEKERGFRQMYTIRVRYSSLLA
jgi:hypothetical protein